ncbi:MAG: hypothetical protein HYX72_12545 [Acidobacteria bacterium]|nr:hypothetical protein [Acidobacteriota bacterium]
MTLVLSNEDVARLLPMNVAIEALEPSYCDLICGEALSPVRRDMLIPLNEAEKSRFVAALGRILSDHFSTISQLLAPDFMSSDESKLLFRRLRSAEPGFIEIGDCGSGR